MVATENCDSDSAIAQEIESFSHRGVQQYCARTCTFIIHPFEVPQQTGKCAQAAEAWRRGDFAELGVLTLQKLELDRALRQLHNQDPSV